MEDEIKRLKKWLQDAEDVDPLFMNPQMKALRHFVFFTHARVEEFVGLEITKDNLKDQLPAAYPYTPEQQSMVYAGTVSLIEHKSYAFKVEDAGKRPLIDAATKEVFDTVNDLRNAFGHPSIPKFRDVLIALESNRVKYKEALEVLVDAHSRMNTISLQTLSRKTS